MVIRTAWLLIILCSVAASAQPAKPWQFGPFVRPAVGNPIITPQPASTFLDPILGTPAHWEALHTFNPAAVVRNGKVFVLYRAEDDSGAMEIGGHTSRLGLADSSDGIHFTRHPEPVFFPGKDAQQTLESPGGVEDPRLVEAPDGTYVLTYTQWNRTTYSVGVATSPDLVHWTKHGPAFGPNYPGAKYKSAGILTHLVAGRLIAAKVNGMYWMYWGEGAIHLATSFDLIHWTPNPTELLSPRPQLFDSFLPEVGPPPVLTGAGIVMLYNGKNADDPHLASGAYAVGEALFDGTHPDRLLARTGTPVFQPEMPFERSGQYAAGTTFAEGLVWFHNQWILYYGCADSLVAVALAPRK